MQGLEPNDSSQHSYIERAERSTRRFLAGIVGFFAGLAIGFVIGLFLGFGHILAATAVGGLAGLALGVLFPRVFAFVGDTLLHAIDFD